MIPEPIVEFLQGPLWVWVGTRDANLQPSVVRVVGWQVSDDRRQLTCLLPGGFGDQTAASLRDNGQLALTAADGVSHECYQFKGTLAKMCVPDDARMEVWRGYRSAMVEAHGAMLSPGVMQKVIPRPVLAVTIELREIFNQTPGPGAGEQLFVAEDAEAEVQP